jgi:CubicO group peptidase (beta-lactamase class C family)
MPGFEPVRDQFAAHFAGGLEQGAGFCARLNGETVVSLTGGFADRAASLAFDYETLVPVYSTTKGIAALVLASLVQDLPARYETQVADLWPEFAAHGKHALTIGDVAAHRAGLAGFGEAIDPGLWLDPPACAAAIASAKPMWPPGSAHGYHPLSWGYLVGEIAQRLSGRTLGTLLREDFCAPHGIDFHIGLPASEHARCADTLRPKVMPDLGALTPIKRAAFLEKWSAPDRGGAVWREIEIPSANGHGTAESVARLYELYASGGSLEGARLIDRDTFESLIEVRSEGDDLVLPLHTAFGAGIMWNTHGRFGPNPSALGHSGWGGSMAVADRDEHLAMAYVMNRQSNILVGDPRAVALVEAVYGCL